jgi:hypothetical protein
MNVKELLTNKELMDSIVEDIEDFPEDSEVTYEVWALGYTEGGESTEEDVLVDVFLDAEADPAKAVACAKNVTLDQLKDILDRAPKSETAYFSIEVETVVEDPEDEGTMNIGTIYQRELQV